MTVNRNRPPPILKLLFIWLQFCSHSCHLEGFYTCHIRTACLPSRLSSKPQGSPRGRSSDVLPLPPRPLNSQSLQPSHPPDPPILIRTPIPRTAATDTRSHLPRPKRRLPRPIPTPQPQRLRNPEFREPEPPHLDFPKVARVQPLDMSHRHDILCMEHPSYPPPCLSASTSLHPQPNKERGRKKHIREALRFHPYPKLAPPGPITSFDSAPGGHVPKYSPQSVLRLPCTWQILPPCTNCSHA